MADDRSNTRRLLVVEDDRGLQRQVKWCFDGYEVVVAEDRDAAIVAMRRYEPRVVLQDLGLPPDPAGLSEGFASLREILALAPHTKIIVMTGNGDTKAAVDAIGLGAWDFYQKPVVAEVLRLIVERAFHVAALEAENRRRHTLQTPDLLEGIVAVSDEMLALCRKIEKLAPADVSVLLRGESGTGKEVAARAIHTQSPRAARPFMAINCAALSEQLLESELFGHEKGAFTGATDRQRGRLELADGGTFFLDEVGELKPELQAKLLRVLQERRFERVGGSRTLEVDVRWIAATNRDLRAMIDDGRFREDLYHRLAVFLVHLPALATRREDIPDLAETFARHFASRIKKRVSGLTEGAKRLLASYDYPGNVRELRNIIERAVILAQGLEVSDRDIVLPDAVSRETRAAGFFTVPMPSEGPPPTLEVVERHYVSRVLDHLEGRRMAAAQVLGISYPTFLKRLRELGLD